MSTLVLNPAAAVPASAAAAAASSQLAADCEHFSKLCCNKAPSPHFLALFSRNQWNVKWPVYAKKGFYRLTSGRFNRAKCAVSARSRLNSPWLVGCFSLLCGRGGAKHTFTHLHHEWSLSAPNWLQVVQKSCRTPSSNAMHWWVRPVVCIFTFFF